MKGIVQIVPYLPPTISGVGDHALLLAEELRRSHDIHSRFLVADPRWNGTPDLNGFIAERLTANTANALQAWLSQNGTEITSVILHYVGYGYQKRGCPVWLLNGLEEWRKERPSQQLVTMFHELYAFGPPWRSSFWTSALQRRLAAKIARLSAEARTNRETSATWLNGIRGTRYHAAVAGPVFSNFGELDNIKAFADRTAVLVMIGGRNWLAPLLTRHAHAVRKTCRLLGIEKVVTIGSPAGLCGNLNLPFEELGILSATEIARQIAQSRFGLMRYFPGYLGKSGIFAAYAAHSVVPLLLKPTTDGDEGLVAGRHYLHLGQVRSRWEVERLQAVADCAFRWYQPHNLERTAAWFAGVISSRRRPEHDCLPLVKS